MSTLTIQLPTQEEQTELNLRRWTELLADQELARWSGRMETDRHGHIIMSPPASFEDGGFQAEISHLLKMHLPTGKICGECPISTPDGVKVADAAWISREKLAKIGRHVCLLKAPEICIEILSPSNSRRELAEKKALSFAAGAEEVWFCDEAGRMTFYIGALSTGEPTSRLCPSFPAVVLE